MRLMRPPRLKCKQTTKDIHPSHPVQSPRCRRNRLGNATSDASDRDELQALHASTCAAHDPLPPVPFTRTFKPCLPEATCNRSASVVPDLQRGRRIKKRAYIRARGSFRYPTRRENFRVPVHAPIPRLQVPKPITTQYTHSLKRKEDTHHRTSTSTPHKGAPPLLIPPHLIDPRPRQGPPRGVAKVVHLPLGAPARLLAQPLAGHHDGHGALRHQVVAK